MPTFFKKIIVPVDFTSNTDIAVTKAMELGCTENATIYLLHVIKPKSVWRVNLLRGGAVSARGKSDYSKQVFKKLQEWKQAMLETNPSIRVEACTMEGSVLRCIVDFAEQINPGLIILGKKSNSNVFTFLISVDPNKIARLTKCPVMTAISSSYHTKVKTIVVPVSSFVPKRKIELVSAFAANPHTTIDLVARMGDQNRVLLETYRILKSRLRNPIEYHFLNDDNFAIATLKHAQSIGADMLFVNPYTESRVSVLTGKHINDMLTGSSKLKILSVEPYHHE